MLCSPLEGAEKMSVVAEPADDAARPTFEAGFWCMGSATGAAIGLGYMGRKVAGACVVGLGRPTKLPISLIISVACLPGSINGTFLHQVLAFYVGLLKSDYMKASGAATSPVLAGIRG